MAPSPFRLVALLREFALFLEAERHQQTMTTWQDFDAVSGTAKGGAEVTKWNYNTAGALVSKTLPDGTGPSYAYDSAGRLQTRWSARSANGQPIAATYAYDFTTGALAEVDYTDGTPSVYYANFDRLGRPHQARDASGTRVLAYTHRQTALERYTDGLLAGFAVTHKLDASDQLTELSIQQNGAAVYDVNYSWSEIGRLGSVTAGNPADGGTGDTATYAYAPESNLVASVTLAHGGNARLTTTKSQDNLNRLTEVDNLSSTGQAMNVAYQYNARNQRSQATREDGTYWSYSYDDLGQVASGARHLADGTPIPGLDFEYAYDSMGNRQTTTTNGRDASYYSDENKGGDSGANLLNQYGSRDVPRSLDVLGTANANAVVSVNGQPATFTGTNWYDLLNFTGNNSAQWTSVNVLGQLNGTQTSDSGNLFLAAHPENFTHDADGNLLSDGRFNYTWDAENRLSQVVTNDAAAMVAGVPRLKIVYVYDGTGRRVGKQVYAWSAVSNSWISTSNLSFLYDGWNLIAEINNAAASPGILRSYIWGLDLSGSRQGACGVGGLLMADLPDSTGMPTRVYYSYDANGNVLGLTDAITGNTVANYDYDSFGNTVSATGPLAQQNPIRFSTKYYETETGLIDYGARYYHPSLGRWLSREPMGEAESPNLYALADNDPVDDFDVNGMYDSAGHFYTTYLVAQAAGYSSCDAFNLAYYSQYPDQNPDYSAGFGFLNSAQQAVNMYLHSLRGDAITPEHLQTQLTCLIEHTDDSSVSGMTGVAVKGILIHALGDAYAHNYDTILASHSSGGPHPISTSFYKTIPATLYGEDVGHLWEGHLPDYIDTDAAKYNTYVDNLYSIMKTMNGGATTHDDWISGLKTAALALGPSSLTDFYSDVDSSNQAEGENLTEVTMLRGLTGGYTGSYHPENYNTTTNLPNIDTSMTNYNSTFIPALISYIQTGGSTGCCGTGSH